MRFLIVLSLTAGLLPAELGPGPSDSVLEKTLDKIAVSELARQKAPGMAVVVVRDMRIAYAKGFGVASVESKLPVTPDTLFRTGVTRMLTAAAAVRLSEQGRLRLDAPLGDYMFNLDPKEAALTTKQILGPADAAGEGGDALEGRLMAAIRGKSFPAVMDELVLSPLGMKSTTYSSGVAMTYPLALGHSAKKQVMRPLPIAAGSPFTSATDLGRFLIAYLNDGKLGDVQALPAGVIAALGKDGGYGFAPSANEHFLQRFGTAPGYTGALIVSLDFKTGVVVLMNQDGTDALLAARKLLEASIPVRYPLVTQ
jgi:CubicO group peptidase (beta-lactamase class C family)